MTFLNPLFSKFVSGHITGVPVYWRLFWNLQLTFIVVAAICIVARNVQYRMPMLFMVICIVLCQNGFIYIRENFEWIKNPEKANATSYNIVKTLEDDSISEDITIFAPEEYTYDIRQISGKIKLAWSRYAHPEDLCGIYSYIYENRTISQDMIEILKEHGINYLVLYQGTEFANMSKNNKSVYSDENIIMFRVY